MKRPIMIHLSLIVALLSMLVIGTALAQDDDGIEPVRGAVTVIADSVFILEVDAEQEKFVDLLTVLEPGETLRTDEGGTALVTWFYDGTESALTQGSSLTLNEFSGESDGEYVIDLSLDAGHLVSGLGNVAETLGSGTLSVTTPEFTVALQRGQFEVSVDEEGGSWVAVTTGQAQLMVGDAEAVTLEANQAFVNGAVASLSEDGVTPALEGVCTATATTNLVLRMFPSENSQRLDGIPTDQVLWVRAGTEGNLWLQVYHETDPLQNDLYNYGWVYGPATTLSEEGCEVIPRAVLDAKIYGGAGFEEVPEAESEE